MKIVINFAPLVGTVLALYAACTLWGGIGVV